MRRTVFNFHFGSLFKIHSCRDGAFKFHSFQYYHNSDSLQVLRKAIPKGYSLDAVLMGMKALKEELIECYRSRERTCLCLGQKNIRWNQRRLPGGGKGTCMGL